MQFAPAHHRLPRAGVDPITDPDTALAAIALTIHRPLRHETIALLLDDERRGIALVVVSGTSDPDDVVEVVELLTAPGTHAGRIGSIVVASVRPDEPPSAGRCSPAEGDVDRWLELSHLADLHGVEMLEWFVIAPGVTCPRDHLCEPPRW